MPPSQGHAEDTADVAEVRVSQTCESFHVEGHSLLYDIPCHVGLGEFRTWLYMAVMFTLKPKDQQIRC